MDLPWQISIYSSNGELMRDGLINREFDNVYCEFNFNLESLIARVYSLRIIIDGEVINKIVIG
jgi:hypothetical protein